MLLCYGCNFHAIFMPPTKKYENPWVRFKLTPLRGMLDLNAITTTQRGPIVYQCFTNKYYSRSARFSNRKKIRGYPSEPSLFSDFFISEAYLSAFIISIISFDEICDVMPDTERRRTDRSSWMDNGWTDAGCTPNYRSI